MKEKIVGFLEKKGEAIDFTLIYYFRTTKPIKSGTLLKWDSESRKIIIEPSKD